MEDASFICCTEGSTTRVPFKLTATNVAVNVMQSGIEVESRAKIEACKRAGRTGRFWIPCQIERAIRKNEEPTEAAWGILPVTESSSGLVMICSVNWNRVRGCVETSMTWRRTF